MSSQTHGQSDKLKIKNYKNKSTKGYIEVDDDFKSRDFFFKFNIQ